MKFVLGLLTIISVSLFAADNLAPDAALSASDEKTVAQLTDGIKLDPVEGQWAARSFNHWWGGIEYPWVELTWSRPRTVNKVVIYDRPSLTENAAACVLDFSDGSRVYVNAIAPDGSPKTVVFEPRTITTMKLTCLDGYGANIGLSELEVYYDSEAEPPAAQNKTYTDFVSYVDPTIETGRGRWFFCTPASRPFGMVSASAYTRNKNQMGGGYNYNSTEILGFAQIHGWIMSGINLMPTTGTVEPNLGEQGWKSSFSHETEIIEAGYHNVFLDRYNVGVEYTSTDRVAFYRLKYKEDAKANLLVSLGGFLGAVSNVDAHVTKISDTRIEGFVGMTDRLWGGPLLTHVFFVLETNTPFDRMDGWKGQTETLSNITKFSNPVPAGRLSRSNKDKKKYLFKNVPSEQAGVALAHDVTTGDEMNVKIGISYTSIENARNNLAAECAHWDFDKVRSDSRSEWNDWLGKMAVKGGTQAQQVKFYTDLWHVLLGRHKLDDINGDFPSYMTRKKDGRFVLDIQRVAMNADGKPKHHMYNSDALWLTMWNLNILWGLGWPQVHDDMAASFIKWGQLGGTIPRGPSAGGYTGIMTGCPGTSLITSAWQKDILTKADGAVAYDLMKKCQAKINPGSSSPGVLIQNAFENWALAQMAEKMGKTDDVKSFEDKINAWKECYHPEIKLLMARNKKDKTQWATDNPLSGHGWVEANAWQGTFGVSHDIKGLAKLMGGREQLAQKLNEAFEKAAPTDFVYAYGGGYVSYANQPGCSNAHVFNHAGHPWLSQYWVRRVNEQAYGGTNPNIGYGGHDEDQGQMGGVSALMSLGLFSLRGTSSSEPVYEITSPVFDEITIQLDPTYYSGKQFKIKTHNNSRDNIYIQKAQLNGEPLDTFWFYHKDFAKGGLLELWLGPVPNKNWGTGPIPE